MPLLPALGASAALPVAALVLGALSVSPRLVGTPSAPRPAVPGSHARAAAPVRPAGPLPHGEVPSAPAPTARQRWAWPLEPRPVVAGRFEPPSSRYGPGHRGLDLVAGPGAVIRAVEAGRVTHAGVIAGRGTLTVLHASGLRSTYEPVHATVHVGAVVARGQPIATLEDVGARSHCAPGSCLHLGAIRGALYLDPLAFLTGVRVRLLPLE